MSKHANTSNQCKLQFVTCLLEIWGKKTVCSGKVHICVNPVALKSFETYMTRPKFSWHFDWPKAYGAKLWLRGEKKRWTCGKIGSSVHHLSLPVGKCIFICLFPCHLYIFHLFCFNNYVIFTLNRTDSSHYIQLLWKGNVYMYVSCLHYIHLPKTHLNNGFHQSVVLINDYKLISCIAWSKIINKTLKDYQHCCLSVVVVLLIKFVQWLTVKSEY